MKPHPPAASVRLLEPLPYMFKPTPGMIGERDRTASCRFRMMVSQPRPSKRFWPDYLIEPQYLLTHLDVHSEPVLGILLPPWLFHNQ